MSTPEQGKQDLGGEAAVSVADTLGRYVYLRIDGGWVFSKYVRTAQELVNLIHADERIAALEARLEALNSENAKLNAENRDLFEKWSERGARLAEAERALREIAESSGDWTYAGKRARAALPPESETAV